jgi:hypothetical protein
MTFKSLQKLAVVGQIRDANGKFLPKGSVNKVIVIKMVDGDVIVRDTAYTREKGEPLAPRLKGPVTAFAPIPRGRQKA